MNCWDFKKCGRQTGGERVEELGTCPASTDSTLHGINGGNNAGRYCWKVAGTFCDGKIQGSFASKIVDCIECDFFKKVQKEEGKNFKFTVGEYGTRFSSFT